MHACLSTPEDQNALHVYQFQSVSQLCDHLFLKKKLWDHLEHADPISLLAYYRNRISQALQFFKLPSRKEESKTYPRSDTHEAATARTSPPLITRTSTTRGLHSSRIVSPNKSCLTDAATGLKLFSVQETVRLLMFSKKGTNRTADSDSSPPYARGAKSESLRDGQD